MKSTFVASRPFLKWVGGKSQLIADLSGSLPPDFDRTVTTYVEPFVGGGAFLFWMLTNKPHLRHVVVNDVNPDLVAAYRCVKGHVDELIAALRGIQTNYTALSSETARKNYFLEQRALFNSKSNPSAQPDPKRTGQFLFLNKTCFNGLYRVNSKGLFNVPFGRYSNPAILDETTLRTNSKLLQKVEILCGDFEKTDQPHFGRKTFFYFDPPYRPLDATSSFTAYAKEGFDDLEQIRLKEFADRLGEKGCRLMLSNADCQSKNPNDRFFEDLYAKYEISHVWASRSINAKPEKRGRLSELLIRNYSLP